MRPRRFSGPRLQAPRNDIEVDMFIVQRPIAAVMATLATTVIFTVIDLLLRYAAH